MMLKEMVHVHGNTCMMHENSCAKCKMFLIIPRKEDAYSILNMETIILHVETPMTLKTVYLNFFTLTE